MSDSICCMFSFLWKQKNETDRHRYDMKGQEDESLEARSDSGAAGAPAPEKLTRSTSGTSTASSYLGEARNPKSYVKFAGMMPMGVSIVNEYSCGSVKFGAKAIKYGIWMLAVLFTLYFVYGGFKMSEDPADTATVHRAGFFSSSGFSCGFQWKHAEFAPFFWRFDINENEK